MELKSCPICGGEPEFQHFNTTPNVQGRIICSCGLEIRQGINETEDDLRIIWNTRANEGTRYSELFGTPERAAKTLEDGKTLCAWCDTQTCAKRGGECSLFDYDALLEWLGGDAE